MRAKFIPIMAAVLLAAPLAACAPADNPSVPPAPAGTPEPTGAASPGAPEGTAEGMPARPGSLATGDPSGRTAKLVELSGTVREVREGLVLIETDKGGEYMLRFSDNSKWADGVDTKLEAGNRITCRVKPEPTLTTPAQGEVYEVIENKIK